MPGQWKPTSPDERTVDDILEETLHYRGFWGEKGVTIGEASYR